MSDQQPIARSPGRESTPCDTDRRVPERQLSLAVPDAGGESGSPIRIPDRETGLDDQCVILKEHVPVSWFVAGGIPKVLRRFIHRLPDVRRCHFLTFTVDPKDFTGPASAFDYSRDHLRKVFYRLRKGVEWKGKWIQIDAPYAVKVEFHRNGYAHFHVLFLTQKRIPWQLLSQLWGLGRTNRKSINQKKFEYLLKYVTKSGDVPEWVKERTRLRIWQTSRGFYLPEEVVHPPQPQREKEERSDEEANSDRAEKGLKKHKTTIGERLAKWRRMATLVAGDTVRSVTLKNEFHEILGQRVLALAREGRYRGQGKVILERSIQILEWINQKELMKLTRFLSYHLEST